jgi:hypothetical protein
VFHAVRGDEDIAPIFQHGLRYNSNVSFDQDGQAFEDEGGTILVFRKADVQPRTKEYQGDGVVTKVGAKPVAIIKDTQGVIGFAGTKERDDEVDKFTEAWEANNKLADGLWRGAGLEKECQRRACRPDFVQGVFTCVVWQQGGTRGGAS